MSKPRVPNNDEDDALYFKSLNLSGQTTIIFLHGLGVSHREYDGVISYITSRPSFNNYHLLLPDLPAHTGSSHIPPQSIPAQARLIADLIRKHAQNSRAHVVGISMGGYIAQNVAAEEPELVMSLFVTGSAPWSGWRLWMARHVGIVKALDATYQSAPGWLKKKLNPVEDLVSVDLKKDAEANRGGNTMDVVFESIARDATEDVVKKVGGNGVRACAVAGGEQDDVEATRVQGRLLRGEDENRSATKAFVLREGGHAWALQFPELFGRAVMAWVEERDMPNELEELI